ncbi:MAG: acetyl-CoA carboxylase biotin carboxylase subunit [Pseudonocardiaceae bacterium]
MFDGVLIANRGEIALRILRTCRELDIRTIAVYSTAERDSAVLRLADETVCIGPAPARRSYLNAAALIEAARKTGAEAIHPGYGFLSEDADFADICAQEGIQFIGPPAAILAKLSDKAQAKRVMADAGLPVLPGSARTVESAAECADLARRLGFPLIVKAAAGGGGRGMTVVREQSDLRRAYESTRAGAQAVFGDGRVYVERFLETARHVEVQVLCDGHRNGVYLGERDCSVQWRHQKLLEETPSPGLSDQMRQRMGEASLQAAHAVGYVGVGTFEFLLDTEGNFHFMEINCRLQVEHPVTEMVTGLDLVREQLLVAAGYPLTWRQDDVSPRGVAMECRINAEDPTRRFAPTPGLLEEFVPAGGPFTRVDTHAYPGMRVTPYYDPLLAKVTVWAADRGQALPRMARALTEFRIAGSGVRTTIGFLREVLAHPLFRDGKHTTSLVEEMLTHASAGTSGTGYPEHGS